MKFCRINLSKTNYSYQNIFWAYCEPTNYHIDKFNDIYKEYCAYKNFTSVMPIFDSQYTDKSTDIIGYFHQDQLVAFSLIKRYDDLNVEALQFAWDYKNPELQLGYKSLETECALYKSRGFRYLYLGQAAKYKSTIDGYEIIGKL